MDIFVVEESEIYIKAAMKIFNGLEYTLTFVKSVSEAKLYLKSNKPDILLLDINLEGGSGLEVVKYLRENKKDRSTYIILLTSETHEEIVTSLYNKGIDYYIRKPFSPSLLKALVDRIGQRVDEFVCVLKGE